MAAIPMETFSRNVFGCQCVEVMIVSRSIIYALKYQLVSAPIVYDVTMDFRASGGTGKRSSFGGPPDLLSTSVRSSSKDLSESSGWHQEVCGSDQYR